MRAKNSLVIIMVMAAAVTMLMPSGILAESRLSNLGFESDIQEPWYWWGNGGTGTYGVPEYARSGRMSVKVAADGEDYAPLGFLQDFECTPGREVTVSAWIMSPVEDSLTNSNAFIKLEFWGEDPITPLEIHESGHLTGTFDWTEAAISGKAPEGTVKAKIGLFIWNLGANHSGTVYFDDAKVLVGDPVWL